MGIRKKVAQVRVHDMARGLDAASRKIAERPAMEEVTWQQVFDLLTKIAEDVRQLALSRGDGKRSSNDVAQGILLAVENMKEENPPQDRAYWLNVALAVSLLATSLRVEFGLAEPK